MRSLDAVVLRLPVEVLRVELARHGAPHLHALHVGNVPGARQVQPVGLIQLGACRQA
jgi:hypothetical protein